MRTLLIVLALSVAGPARAEDLSAFLRDATAATRAATALRADGTLTGTELNGPVEKKFVLLRSPDGTLLLDFGDAGERVLIPATGKHAYRRSAGSSDAEPVSLGRALDDTDFTLEDLRPFNAVRFGSPIIADRNERQITVSLDPHDSQYSLIVVTFDRKRKIPLKTMYYVDTLNNLVKMRRDGAFIRIAGSWVPGTVAMEDFKLRTSTELALHWREAADTDVAYFAPSSFAAAPPLH